MKFFSDKKDLSVINKITKRRIALFTNGEFETDNLDVIEKLKPHFGCESPKIASSLANFLKLKKEAMDKGVYKKGMKKKDLEEALEEFNLNKK